MANTREKKLTYKEWSEKLAKEAEGITEEEINETLRQLKSGDTSCIEPGISQEEAKKILDEVYEAAQKMMRKAEKLSRKRTKPPPDKVA